MFDLGLRGIWTAAGEKIVKRSGGEPVAANLACQVHVQGTAFGHRIMTRPHYGLEQLIKQQLGERAFTSKLCLPELL